MVLSKKEYGKFLSGLVPVFRHQPGSMFEGLISRRTGTTCRAAGGLWLLRSYGDVCRKRIGINDLKKEKTDALCVLPFYDVDC